MTARRATYQDVIDAPEGLTAEILDGELWLTPHAATPHQWVETAAAGSLQHGPASPEKGWVILVESELWLGADDPRSEVVVPDLVGWRRERFSLPPEHGHVVRPDWVCEILSPTPKSLRRDRVRKPPIYARHGVGWMWIVDPIGETVEVHRLTGHGTWEVVARAGGDDVARLPPFDTEDLPLARWWVSCLERGPAP